MKLRLLACILLWMIAPTLINSWTENWCQAQGESSDGYNPSYCFVDKNVPNAITEQNKENPCCAVASTKDYIPSIPTEINRFLEVKKDGWTSFNYVKFVRSELDTYFIPLAVPLYTNRWKIYEMNDGLDLFAFDIVWDCSQSITKNHKNRGFPLFTMSYTRFGDDLPPPDRYDVKKCDLCVNTAYILQQSYDFATNMFECSSGTRRIHAEISPELNTIGKINSYTRSALRFGLDWPNISSNLRGGICPLKLVRWQEFKFKAEVIEKNQTIHRTLQYGYLPLRIHKPGKIYVWNKTEINTLTERNQMPNGGAEQKFPFSGFTIEFPPNNKLLVRPPTPK